jgi:hypothetical protein
LQVTRATLEIEYDYCQGVMATLAGLEVIQQLFHESFNGFHQS